MKNAAVTAKTADTAANKEVIQMNSIKFNSDYFDNLITESNKNITNLSECIDQLSYAAHSIEGCNGFGIDEAREAIINEIKHINLIREKCVSIKAASEKAALIYANAENSVKRKISELPVLIHGNICSKADKHSVFYEAAVPDCKEEIKETSASRLLKSNTVMHEDWLLALTAEIIFNKG